ncbi:hypothetical protein [Nocardia niigatensis]
MTGGSNLGALAGDVGVAVEDGLPAMWCRSGRNRLCAGDFGVPECLLGSCADRGVRVLGAVAFGLGDAAGTDPVGGQRIQRALCLGDRSRGGGEFGIDSVSRGLSAHRGTHELGLCV